MAPLASFCAAGCRAAGPVAVEIPPAVSGFVTRALHGVLQPATAFVEASRAVSVDFFSPQKAKNFRLPVSLRGATLRASSDQ